MVRGVNFLSRDKYLMARIKSQHSDTALSRHTAGSLLCYRVPAHLRRKHWSQLLTVSAYTAQLTDTLSAAQCAKGGLSIPALCTHTPGKQQPAAQQVQPHQLAPRNLSSSCLASI